MDLNQKVLETIRRYHMLKKGDRVMAAVSGGPDSAFLLRALLKNRDRLGVEVFVANMDHGIRGQASRADSEFVKKMAAEQGLKTAFKRTMIKKTRGFSVEENARAARYDFFKEAAAKLSANVVATGHTLDDQAETVIMRVIKGASLKGVIGIPPVRHEDGVRVIRPLICLTKKEIVGFLKANGIRYRMDATNLEEKFFRNAARKKIIPFLEQYNPRLKRALFNMAESLREDYEFIENEKNKSLQHIKKRKGHNRIDLKNLVMQPRALQKEVMREMLMVSGANIKKLTYRHWKDMEELLNSKPRGKALDLPGGVRVCKEKDALCFFRL